VLLHPLARLSRRGAGCHVANAANWRGFAGPGDRLYIMTAVSSTPIPATVSSDSLRVILERHGVRPTAQRLQVAEVLLSAPQHLTAEQILVSLRRSSGRVSKATLYNTLKLFVERGLARQIHLDPDRCVYDSTMAPHHHFQVVETGEMIDIEPGDISFARMPPLPAGTEIASVDVVIRLRRRG
jgi:Fur family iron response transcriptional regulator